MTEFAIEFDPKIPGDATGKIDYDLSTLQAKVIMSTIPTEYNLIYVIDGTRFFYYPANILTVLNDLDLELSLVRDRRAHGVTLSGYTVLEIKFENECAHFFDPVGGVGYSRRKIGTGVDAAELENELMYSIARVWNYILEQSG